MRRSGVRFSSQARSLAALRILATDPTGASSPLRRFVPQQAAVGMVDATDGPVRGLRAADRVMLICGDA
jgi:hypothetical protein